MSIGGIKVVEIGEYPLGKKGSEYHDELFVNDGKIFRKTNNAGGIEGGITNGEDLVVKAVMKPIPTMIKPLNNNIRELNELERSSYWNKSYDERILQAEIKKWQEYRTMIRERLW